MSETFAVRLKRLREQKHMTPTELADASGVPRVHLYPLEKGDKRPNWETVQKLAVALGVSTDELRDETI